eukprot:jgi/Botrbrau1/6146/Bobra.331_2s0036.2
MSDWKNRLKSESQHGVTAAPEALADVIIDKGSRKVLDKFGVNERTLEADQAQADPEYAANKVIKEAVHTLQNDEVAKTGHTEAGGVAAAAQIGGFGPIIIVLYKGPKFEAFRPFVLVT